MSKASKEELVASKLYDLLSDVRLEPYLVGRYFAQMAQIEIYDNFEEMVESARDEKQNRIDWIKEIIIGEKDMTTTFDSKVLILSDMLIHCLAEPEWGDGWGEAWNSSLFLAHLIKHGMAIPTEAGVQDIHDCFSGLLVELDIDKDTGFHSIEDIFDGWEPLPF
jgi:hypothetical protein